MTYLSTSQSAGGSFSLYFKYFILTIWNPLKKKEEEEKEGKAEEEGEIFQWKIMKSQEYIPMMLNFASIKFSPFYFQLTSLLWRHQAPIYFSVSSKESIRYKNSRKIICWRPNVNRYMFSIWMLQKTSPKWPICSSRKSNSPDSEPWNILEANGRVPVS